MNKTNYRYRSRNEYSDSEITELDPISYSRSQEKLKILKAELRNKHSEKIEAYDGHERYSHSDLQRSEYQTNKEIAELESTLNRSVVISRDENLDENTVDIGDEVTVRKTLRGGDSEILTFELLTSSISLGSQQVVTIKCPMGMTIRYKKVGDMVSYQVGDKIYDIVIMERKAIEIEEPSIYRKRISNN